MTQSTPPGSALAHACVVVPAFDAEATIAGVVRDLRDALPGHTLLVVDDGSRDGTARVAAELGCTVVGHGDNRGKGAALRTGLATALALGHAVAVTVDADGQHPAEEARNILHSVPDADALVLGVRDLVRDGAPKKNQLSNGISNHFLSRFAGRALADTQCGLRRYPIARTLALGAKGDGYEFEAEVLLRAVWSGMPVVERPVRVLYPDDRVTHFHVVRDPWRIVRTVVGVTLAHARGAA